ncbi:extracellular catalytic domain type 1 short-chain-length polyhydroxyalkanoate depolymerase [Spirosoma radiotolerans]|uniref:Phospholipase/carboxylesterase n=1 Tax=Spirosoma radiotolerans TaxID=1379870 RepID=A0A0E3ZWM9_9BACT|nr:PHB depolymerase family esterase [Spirosoma radiotolerans]AKD55829.1 phospholipase/carboxylesterase [Spirosoma radiotolerans]
MVKLIVGICLTGFIALTNKLLPDVLIPSSFRLAAATEASVRDTIQHDGQVRIYWVHLPSSYAKTDTSLPLVIALHGGGGSGQQFEAQSKLSEKADKEGFIVVYPDGRQNPGVLRLRTWNAGGCCGQISSVQHTDDVGFIKKLIDKLADTYRVDTKRVYATGHSNGAMLCYRLACELPDKLAAIAANSGTMQIKTACQPRRVMPILHIHSQLDQNVPFAGGVGLRSLNKQWNAPVDSTLNVFARLAHCTTQKQVVQKTSSYTFYKWATCTDGIELHYYLTTDGGHSWPGGTKAVRMVGDPPSEAFLNNDIIWQFFKNYALP